MKRIGFLFGLAFGGFIAAGRMNEYQVIHGGLRLQNFYIVLAMGSAIAVATPLLYLLRRYGWKTPYGGPLDLNPARIERKHIFGGVVFGIGWAVANTCPAPALAMVGGGGPLGLCVVAGIFFGIVLRDAVVARSVKREPVAPERREHEPAHGLSPAGAALDL